MSTVHVFVSYSHRDDAWVKEGPYGLIPWLAQQLKRSGVEIWYDHALKQLPGAEYRKLIKSEIDRADLAILLISQDFVSSDFIQKFELPWIRQRVERGDLSLIPILVGPTLDEDLDWLADRQMLPGKPAPLVEYTESTAKWQAVRLDILGAIRDRAREIAARGPAEPPARPAADASPLSAAEQAPQSSSTARAAAESPEAIAAEFDRAAEEEEARARAEEASAWLGPAGGIVRKQKTLAVAVGLGLLGVAGIIALAAVVHTRHAEPTAAPPPATAPVAATAAGKTPAATAPAGKPPVAATPGGKAPAGKTAAAATPAGKTPAGKTPAAPAGAAAPGRASEEQLVAARAAYNAKNYALAMKLYGPLANQGNSESQYYLGELYEQWLWSCPRLQQSLLLVPRGGRPGLSRRRR